MGDSTCSVPGPVRRPGDGSEEYINPARLQSLPAWRERQTHKENVREFGLDQMNDNLLQELGSGQELGRN